jgi:hypothetical protein
VTEWWSSLSGDARVLFVLPGFAFAVYCWFQGVINLKGMRNNTIEEGTIDDWAPFGFFRKSIYTEKGKEHLKKFQKYTSIFILVILLPGIIIVISGP